MVTYACIRRKTSIMSYHRPSIVRPEGTRSAPSQQDGIHTLAYCKVRHSYLDLGINQAVLVNANM